MYAIAALLSYKRFLAFYLVQTIYLEYKRK